MRSVRLRRASGSKGLGSAQSWKARQNYSKLEARRHCESSTRGVLSIALRHHAPEITESVPDQTNPKLLSPTVPPEVLRRVRRVFQTCPARLLPDSQGLQDDPIGEGDRGLLRWSYPSWCADSFSPFRLSRSTLSTYLFYGPATGLWRLEPRLVIGNAQNRLFGDASAWRGHQELDRWVRKASWKWQQRGSSRTRWTRFRTIEEQQ